MSFLTKDWTLKLFSLGVAIILFLFVSLESATPADVDFPIDYRTADDIMFLNDAPTVLHTTLQGPWAAFRSFDVGDLEPVTIDLSHAGLGTVRHVIDLTAVRPPAGMRVVAIRPAEVELMLDRRVERQISVHADVPNTPPYGYEIGPTRVTPAKVRVVGPVSAMDGISFIATRPIDVTSRQDNLTIDVDLNPPKAPSRLVDTKRVTVMVEIKEENAQKTLRNVPVTLDNAPTGVQTTPAAVNVTIQGPRRSIDPVETCELFVDVGPEAEDAEDATQVEKIVQLRHDLPERVQLVGPLPKVAVQLPAGKKAKRK